MICGSGGSKSRLAKAAGAEPAGQMRDEKLHAVVARSTFASEKLKTPHVRTTFGSWDVEKVHGIVARSTFLSQNVQNTPGPDHLWKLRCRKKCTPLWYEIHFEVKILKAPTPDHFWILLEVVLRWCAFFRHLTFKKRSETEVFCIFWLRNVFCD